MNGEGNRKAQVAAGIFVGVVCGGLLLGHYFVDHHSPDHVELYIGAGGMLVSAWLIAPVGMGGLVGQARRSWHEFRGHDDE